MSARTHSRILLSELDLTPCVLNYRLLDRHHLASRQRRQDRPHPRTTASTGRPLTGAYSHAWTRGASRTRTMTTFRHPKATHSDENPQIKKPAQHRGSQSADSNTSSPPCPAGPSDTTNSTSPAPTKPALDSHHHTNSPATPPPKPPLPNTAQTWQTCPVHHRTLPFDLGIARARTARADARGAFERTDW